MNILFIGDIVGTDGVLYLKNHLNSIKKLNNIDFTVANAENSTPVGKGINRDAANALYSCGVDALTMGNHTFNNKEIYSLFDDDFPVIRPANMPPATPGDGYKIFDVNGYRVCVINLMGCVFMDSIDCPFRTADSILKNIENRADIILMDFHAEATSEKLAMAYYLDGRVSAVCGTHTHVLTADERILNGGTAYITDLGMTGCEDSVLGVKKEIIIKSFLSHLPQRHEIQSGKVTLNGLIVKIDEKSKRAVSVERISIS